MHILTPCVILAGELALHKEPDKAFAGYEKIMRPFAEANQNLANSGAAIFWPRTQEELEARNQVISALQSSDKESQTVDDSKVVYKLNNLPDYKAAFLHDRVVTGFID